MKIMKTLGVLSIAVYLMATEHGRVVMADPIATPQLRPHAGPVMAQGYLENPVHYDEVSPKGILADRMALSLEKLLRDRKVHTKYIGWGADQIGRWVGAVAVLSTMTDRNADSDLHSKIEELIAVQSNNGLYFGKKLQEDPSHANTRHVWFGQGRAIWNLMEYYRITGDQHVLASLKRAADAAVADRDTIKKLRPYWGDAHTTETLSTGIESAVGPMVVLGQLTGSDRYIDYARYIADNMPHRVGNPSKFVGHKVNNGHHSHSFLSIAHGLVDLSVATGESKYIAQAQDIFEQTLPSVWITGNIPETYGRLFEHRDEICSAVDWISLALKLYDATSNSRYLDVAELSILNQLLSGQDHGGGFTCYRSVDRRNWVKETNHGVVHTGCCSMHGGLALGNVATHVVTRSTRGLSVNLPLDVKVNLIYNDHSVKVSQEVQIGLETLTQDLKVSNDGTEQLSLKVRIPYWSDAPNIIVDGKQHKPNVKNGFVHLTCDPRSEHHFRLTLPMKLQIIPARKNIFTIDANPAIGPATEQGLQYGPFALMFYREMYPKIVDRDISLTIPVDEEDRPEVRLGPLDGWRPKGTIKLFVKAIVGESSQVWLTPCANTTMAPFVTIDPYVLRFSQVSQSSIGNVVSPTK